MCVAQKGRREEERGEGGEPAKRGEWWGVPKIWGENESHFPFLLFLEGHGGLARTFGPRLA